MKIQYMDSNGKVMSILTPYEVKVTTINGTIIKVEEGAFSDFRVTAEYEQRAHPELLQEEQA